MKQVNYKEINFDKVEKLIVGYGKSEKYPLNRNTIGGFHKMVDVGIDELFGHNLTKTWVRDFTGLGFQDYVLNETKLNTEK